MCSYRDLYAVVPVVAGRGYYFYYESGTITYQTVSSITLGSQHPKTPTHAAAVAYTYTSRYSGGGGVACVGRVAVPDPAPCVGACLGCAWGCDCVAVVPYTAVVDYRFLDRFID